MTSNTDAASDDSGERRYVARLVIGDLYVLKDRQMFNGVEHIITEREMLHLSEHAVLTIPTPGYDENYDNPDERTTTRDMFDIRQLGENERIESDVDELNLDGGSDTYAERRERALSKIKPAGSRSADERRKRRDQVNRERRND